MRLYDFIYLWTETVCLEMLRATVLFIAFLFVGVVPLYAVGVVDSITAPRITVGAEEFWVHPVVKGETLYAISRKYGVPQATIAAANPQIYYGVKEGQVLRIPIPEGLRTKKENLGYKLHQVKAGENLYAISRLYGVPVADIRKANALISDTIQLNEILRIPENTVSTAPEAAQVIHDVQKGEGVYGISKRYGVTQEAILEANPWLRERQLELGDKLVIPQSSAGLPDSLANLLGGGIQPPMPCDTAAAFPKWKTLNLVLALPFELGKTQATVSEDEVYDISGTAARGMAANTRYLDFYQGVLLALNDYRLKGYNIRLTVFDTQHSPTVVQKLVQSDTLKHANLIIGPVFPKNLSLVSQYAAQRRIPIVSPLSGKISATDVNPFLFQANPSFYTQLKTLVEKTVKQGTTRIIVLREESLADLEMADKLEEFLRAQIQRLNPPPTLEVLRYPKGEATAKRTPQLRKLIDAEQATKVYIPSNSEPFVSDLLGQLNALSVLKKTDTVEIYGMSRWFKMRNLDLSQLGTLRVILFSPYYVDYQSRGVRDFIDNYRALYRCEPTQFAFQGYDVAKYFLGALYKYGENFHYCLSRYNVPLLQNYFDFRASQDLGSYESRALYLLRFDLEQGLVPLK